MLEVRNLTFQYPSSGSIFSKLSFEMPERGLIHLKGPNGCGKTTLLKILSHLILPQSGELLYQGKALDQAVAAYMPSQPESSFVQLTGKETIDLFCRLNKSEGLSSKYLKHFEGLESYQKALKTKFAFCSTGMKQILNLARSLTKEAPLLLLDEPLHGLDKETKEKLSPLFMEIKENCLIILTSHEDTHLVVDQSWSLTQGRLERD